MPVMEVKSLEAFEPLLKEYGARKHPLEYGNRYQLLVMVLLSAQDSDRHINALAPRLFGKYPTLEDLAAARPSELLDIVGEVVNGTTKAERLLAIARRLGSDERIPRLRAELVELPGIGPKSANVIIRESGDPAEGIIVDLHVVRTAPRIGIATGTDATRIERQLMSFFPKERWGEAGMALSFLGREICRPSYPKCPGCPVRSVCGYAGKS